MSRDEDDDSESSAEGQASEHAAPTERLQKVLAAAGVGSRRDCEVLITEGRVMIDGKVVTALGTKVDPNEQEIRVDGEALKKPRRVYYAVNKPEGVVTTNLDPSGRTRVIDLVPTETRIFAVGRLDRASEGLIIVTNDGALADRITHPRYGVEKTYQVRIAGSISDDDLQKLRHGIHLSDGFAKVVSLKIRGSHKQSTDLEIVLNEGKNREIRRILARVGHKVLTLRRTAVGPLKLANLEPGECRKLAPAEVKELFEATKDRKKKDRPTRPLKAPPRPFSQEGKTTFTNEGRPPRPERPERAGRPPSKPVGGKRPPSRYTDAQKAMGPPAAKSPPEKMPPRKTLPPGDEPLKLEDFLPPEIQSSGGQTRGGVIRYDENEPRGEQPSEGRGSRTYGGNRTGKPGGARPNRGSSRTSKPGARKPRNMGGGGTRDKRPTFSAPPEGLQGGDVPLRPRRPMGGRPPMGGEGPPRGRKPPPGAPRGRRPGPGGPPSGGGASAGPRGRRPPSGGGRPAGGGRPGGRPGGGGGRPGGGGKPGGKFGGGRGGKGPKRGR